jgi:hypothetical protein
VYIGQCQEEPAIYFLSKKRKQKGKGKKQTNKPSSFQEFLIGQWQEDSRNNKSADPLYGGQPFGYTFFKGIG